MSTLVLQPGFKVQRSLPQLVFKISRTLTLNPIQSIYCGKNNAVAAAPCERTLTEELVTKCTRERLTCEETYDES